MNLNLRSGSVAVFPKLSPYKTIIPLALGIMTSHSLRNSCRHIAASISTLSVQDLLDSDDDMDFTLVHSDRDNTSDKEEKYPNPAWHTNKEDDEDVIDGEEDDQSGSESLLLPQNGSVSLARKPRLETAPMAKPKSSRGPPTGDILKLNSDEPWDTFKAQILVAINTALDPATQSLNDYNITFTVPRHASRPIQLKDGTKYKALVENAWNIKKELIRDR
ncbi:hypothetical protein DFH09DRAFT_1301961 [Mycena vulgaris]|nr:hypothetical protein DFH09DRAFT_1301961 [Mycena vulgaris]